MVWIAAATLGGLVMVRLGAVGYGGARQPKRMRGAGALAPLWSRNGGLGRVVCGVVWNGEAVMVLFGMLRIGEVRRSSCGLLCSGVLRSVGHG